MNQLEENSDLLKVLRCAFEVYATLKYGYLESVYEAALEYELLQAGLSAYVCGRYDEAFSWFEQGASLKDADCEFMLGTCYALGRGCSADKEQAEVLLLRARKKGSGLFGKIE